MTDQPSARKVGAEVQELVPIPFRGTELRIASENGSGYAAVAPICRALGIDEQAQRRRIERHPVLSKGGAIMATPSGGGMQETFCLRIDLVPFWLATIAPGRVKPELRDELIAFQSECARVLFAHFAEDRSKVLGSAHMSEWREARRAANRARYRGLQSSPILQ
jgi:P22_AR N-terminal domain